MNCKDYRRPAHSLIEMLVVLIVVTVLIAIIVPAVQRARESARMAQCINHQAQLAKAVHMHVADEPYGRFPGYRAFAADGTTAIGWAPQVFEYLGKNDVPADPAQGTYVELLVCPSNQGPKDAARLNYVVNGGKAGVDSPAEGIFFDHAKPERIYISKDDFNDGLANTIMLAENLDATLWSDTDEESQCILWPLIEGSEVNYGSGSRPSSHHPGGFVTAFADGSVKFMSETDINDDPAVYSNGSLYVSLLTPGGNDAPESEIVGADPCEPLEQAEVDSALDWIVRHQFDDGHWSYAHSSHPDCQSQGPCSHDGTAGQNHIGATAMALLPLLGAGNSPLSGPHKEAVCKGLSYLMLRQNDTDGNLVEMQDTVSGRMYAHLLANLALAEAHKLGVEAANGNCDESSSGAACSIDMSELFTALEAATAYTVDSQVIYVDDGDPAHRKGGWRYGYQGHPINGGQEGDISHTAWALMALKTAELSGVSVPTETYDRIHHFLESVTWASVEDQGVTIGTSFSYDRIGGPLWGQPSTRMTVLGQLCHVLLGAPTDHPAFEQFTSTISPDGDGTHHHSVYFNMHSTHLMYLLGGSNWDAWNTAIQNTILPGQETAAAGHEEGSWDATNPNISGDVGMNVGGRLYTTCMYALSLETHFAGLKLRRHD